MRLAMRVVLGIVLIGGVAFAIAAWSRVRRVTRAATAIPVYPGSREGGGRTRYWPRPLSWDDRSSARVQRVFALSEHVSLATIARHADASLAPQGWYLVIPDDLERESNLTLAVWQRDPDGRLDLTQAWPISGMSRTARLYGGVFPPEFLDAPLVVAWSWALGGPRLSRPSPPTRAIVRPPAPPPPPPPPPPRQ